MSSRRQRRRFLSRDCWANQFMPGRFCKSWTGLQQQIERVIDRRSEDFRVLRKGLGYCWCVAAVALPAEDKMLMEQWLVSADKDIQMDHAKNLKKTRLARMDSTWVEQWRR